MSSRDFYVPVADIKRPAMTGLFPLRWYPAEFSKLLGVGTKSSPKYGRLVRKDVAEELMTDPIRLLKMSSEQELRALHPEYYMFYRRADNSRRYPSQRYEGYAGLVDHIYGISRSDIEELVDVDNWTLFKKVLETAHANAVLPIMKDSIRSGEKLYRREIVHLLVSPDVSREARKEVLKGPFDLESLCRREGLYAVYSLEVINPEHR